MENADEQSQLLKQAALGSREAFAQLYEHTITHVSQTVHFLVDDPSAREDVIQEVYIQLYRSLAKFDQIRPFRPWLTGIIIRQASSHRRKRWMLFRLASKKARQVETIQPDFSNELLERLDNKVLLGQIEQLPYKLKQVIILRYLNEYSQEEVAQILEIPVGTVKSRINAALQKLRKASSTSIQVIGKVETGV